MLPYRASGSSHRPHGLPAAAGVRIGHPEVRTGDDAGSPAECLSHGHGRRGDLQGEIQRAQSRSNQDGASLTELGDVDPARGETVLALFDWTQKAADIWRGSN